MWKCMGLLLFVGQWIIVTSEQVTNEDEISRYARKAGDCCPCPDSTSRNSDTDQSASNNIHDMSCPCHSRNTDSETASSIFSPVLSAIHPYTRQVEKNGDLKPLLEPEVDLASSVLETLREATEEEYQEALARDAARSTQQDELINDVVTSVVLSNARENIGDALPVASNNQERRCISPDDYSNIDGFSRNSPASFDMDNAPSNLYNSLNLPVGYDFPVNFETSTPLQNYKQHFPVFPTRDHSFSPSEYRNHFIPFSRKPLLPALHMRPLFNARRTSDFNNLMNLRDVELIQPRKVTITRERNMQPEAYKITKPSFDPLTDSRNSVPSKSLKIIDFNKNGDCSSDGRIMDTKIISSIPTSDRSSSFQSNSYHEPETNLHYEHPSDKAYKNFATTAEESRHSLNILTNPKESNDLKYFKPENNRLSSHLNDMREINDASSIKDSVLKTLEDFKQANAVMHDHLRSSLDDVLNQDTGQELTDSGNTNTDNHLKEDRSSDSIKNEVSMKDLQHMSDKILLNYDKDEGKTLSIAKLANSHNYNKEELTTYPKTSIQTSVPRENTITNYNLPTNAKETDNDLERESTNLDTCISYDDLNRNQPRLANKEINEMKTAASEPISSRSRVNYDTNIVPKASNIQNSLSNSMLNNPLEDINLDIFQYQPALQGINGRQNLQLPRFNMKSYKTQLPIPNSLDLKPVKLQKAIRTGNDILGATLTMKPHRTRKLYGLFNNKIRSSQNEPNGLGIPNFEDIRSFLENNTPNILKLPFLEDDSYNCASPSALGLSNMNENLRTYAEEALMNAQQTLGNTFKAADVGDQQLIEDTLHNPSDIIETLAEARENANDKVRAFQSDLSDRLKQFHQNLMGQSRAPSLSEIPQHERTPYSGYNLDPKRINANRKYTPNRPLSPNLRQNPQTGSFRTTIDKDNFNSRTSTVKQKPAFSSPRTVTSHVPSSRVETNKGLDNTRLNQKPDQKRPLSLHERLKLARESKGTASFTTTKRPPIVELPTIKPLSSRRPITIPRKDNQPARSRSVLPELNTFTRKQISREPKTSPSEVAYTKIPATARTIPRSSICDENDIDGAQTLSELSQGRSSRPNMASSPRNSFKSSILPNIAENAFLSKVKEAVMSKDLTNKLLMNEDDGYPSASETVRHTETSNGISFDCKMVCAKS